MHASTVTEDEVDLEAIGSDRWGADSGCRVQTLCGTAEFLHSTFETFEEGRESMREPERMVKQLF